MCQCYLNLLYFIFYHIVCEYFSVLNVILVSNLHFDIYFYIHKMLDLSKQMNHTSHNPHSSWYRWFLLLLIHCCCLGTVSWLPLSCLLHCCHTHCCLGSCCIVPHCLGHHCIIFSSCSTAAAAAMTPSWPYRCHSHWHQDHPFSPMSSLDALIAAASSTTPHRLPPLPWLLAPPPHLSCICPAS